MAGPKTQKTTASVSAFLATIEDEEKRKDGQQLLKIFEEITQEKGAMWGNSIVGFGQYHYKSERSKQEGDWPLTGFSPRKQNLTIYIMSGFGDQKKLLQKIGKHKISGGSCLYIKRLSDINLEVLKELIKASVDYMKKKISNGVAHTVPDDLRKMVLSDPDVLALWEDITPLARNEWICWVEDAKKAKTRAHRIEVGHDKLLSGMRRPCCWAGCKHR